MDILSLNVKAPYTRPTESAVIFNNLTNLIPNINDNVKRFLKNQSGKLPVRRHSSAELKFSDEVPLIEVTPPSPGCSRKTTFDIEFNKVILDTLDVCKRKIRRFSEPCLSSQLNLAHLEQHAEKSRRRSMPCISSKHLLKVPKPTKNKKHKRRLSLPIKPSQSELPADFCPLEKSLSGSYERIHYQLSHDGGPPKTVHEIFIPGFGINRDGSDPDMEDNGTTEKHRNNKSEHFTNLETGNMVSKNGNRKSVKVCHPDLSQTIPEENLVFAGDKYTKHQNTYHSKNRNIKSENRDAKSANRNSKSGNSSPEPQVTSCSDLLIVANRDLNKLSKRQNSGTNSTIKELNFIHDSLLNNINGLINDDIVLKGHIINKKSTTSPNLSRPVRPFKQENKSIDLVDGGINGMSLCENRRSLSRSSQTLEKERKTMDLDNRATTQNKSDRKQRKKALPITNLSPPLYTSILTSSSEREDIQLKTDEQKTVLKVDESNLKERGANSRNENQQRGRVNLRKTLTVEKTFIESLLLKNGFGFQDEKKILAANTELRNCFVGADLSTNLKIIKDSKLVEVLVDRYSSASRDLKCRKYFEASIVRAIEGKESRNSAGKDKICNKANDCSNYLNGNQNFVTLNLISDKLKSDEFDCPALFEGSQEHYNKDHYKDHYSCNCKLDDFHVSKSHKPTLDSFENDFFSRDIKTNKSHYMTDALKVISVIKNNEQVVGTMKSTIFYSNNDELCIGNNEQLICVCSDVEEKQLGEVVVEKDETEFSNTNNEELLNFEQDSEMGPTRHFSDIISDVLSGKNPDVTSNFIMSFNGLGDNGKVVYDAKSEDCNVFVDTKTERSLSSDSSEAELDDTQQQTDENGKIALMKSTSLTGLDVFVKKRPQLQNDNRPVSLHGDQNLIDALSGSTNENTGTKSRDDNKPTSKSLEELDGGDNRPNVNRVSALNRLNKDFANAMMRKAVSLVEIQNEKLKENVAKWEKKFLSTEVLSAPDKDWFPRVSMEDCSSCASCRSRSSSYHNLLYDFDTASQFPIYQPTVIDFEEDPETIFDGVQSSPPDGEITLNGSQSSSSSTERIEDINEENELEKTVTNDKIDVKIEEPEEDAKTKMMKLLKKERFVKQSQAAFGSLKDKFRKVKGKV